MSYYQLLEQMEHKKLKELDVKLNKKQEIAWDIMTSGENILITGAGGCGKSLLIELFKTYYNTEKCISVTSTTGTSALIIKGVTLHSYLGIGLGAGNVATLFGKVNKYPQIRKRWKDLDCLIIDEISMLSPDLFDKLEEIARLIRRNDRPFGGIQLILSGDFCQLPVINSNKFCFEAKSWGKCIGKNIIYLTENMRQKNPEFQTCLENVRIGNINNSVKSLLRSRIGAKLDETKGIKPTRLFPINKRVNEINTREINKLIAQGNELKEYNISISFCYDMPRGMKDYLTDKYISSCPVPEKLQICVGAQVMLVVNLDMENGLCNGSRGVITHFVNDCPVVKFINGVTTHIDKYTWYVTEKDTDLLWMTHLPLKVAYAATIHKVQGASIDYVEVELKDVFEYSQAYVALSRVRSLEGLRIRNINFKKIKTHPKALKFYLNLTPMYTFMLSTKDKDSSPYTFFKNEIYDFNMMKEIDKFLN